VFKLSNPLCLAFIHLSLDLFKKYLLSAFHVPDPLLVPGI
jgi:hypothetical protein